MFSCAHEQSSINLILVKGENQVLTASPAWRIEKLIQIHHNNLVMEFFKERGESTRTDKFSELSKIKLIQNLSMLKK